jgi:2'-5' RNA ligase
VRLFVGIEIPPEIRQDLARHVATHQVSLPPAKWGKREGYHITLSYFGEVDEASIPLFDHSLSNAVADQDSFALRLKEAGCFPRSRRAVRILWVGVDNDLAVVQLQSRVTTALETSKLVEIEHRPYHPHVTVARCKKPWGRHAGETWRSSFESWLGLPFEVSGIVLFRSLLEPSGARYEQLRSYPFGGRP